MAENITTALTSKCEIPASGVSFTPAMVSSNKLKDCFRAGAAASLPVSNLHALMKFIPTQIYLGRLRANSRAFTLIELLVTIAIIGILASMLLPALGKSKEKTRAMKCSNNFKQLLLASNMYATDESGYLPPSNWGGDSWGWLYNYDGAQPLLQRFSLAGGKLSKYIEGQINTNMYRCTIDFAEGARTGAAGWEARATVHNGQLVSSYCWNGAVNKYGVTGTSAAPTYGNLTLLESFGGEAYQMWEQNAQQPFYFNDGGNFPGEGINDKHGTGALVGMFGGSALWVDMGKWNTLVASTTKNEVWCRPDTANGR